MGLLDWLTECISNVERNMFSLSLLCCWNKEVFLEKQQAPNTEDLQQRGQLHCPGGREVKGGVKHAMCQPR